MPAIQSGDCYFVNNLAWNFSTPTAATIIQIKAVSPTPIAIIRASITQRGSITNVQDRVQLGRITTTFSTVTSFTPLKVDTAAPASASVGGTAATGIIGTAEGTVVDILVDEGFSVLNGFLWLPTPQEYITINPGEAIVMKFPVAPSVQVWNARINWLE